MQEQLRYHPDLDSYRPVWQSATASRTITVQDTTPPVFDQEPEDHH
ncbi:MAG: hypothetical protein R2787_04445 [Saprospiraceae bacterium]